MMKNSLLFILLVFTFNLYSQEVVQPLIYNSQLPQKLKRNINIQQNNTLTLPFFDDFSQHIGYPNPNLWKDNDVFVNRTYPINPINIGVATFDGLDSIGQPRAINETAHGSADYLTSNRLQLSTYSKVYLSFYLQSTGLGNEPESNDIFYLELLDSSLVWQTVWDTMGYALSDFKKIIYTIDNPIFLHDDFQFRFHNKATLSGNFDHWHLDNVLLTESSLLSNDREDVAFVYEKSNMLNFYTAIPWKHFDQNRAAYMSNTMDSWLRNNYSTPQSVDYRYDIFDQNNTLVFHYPSTGPTRNDEIPVFNGTNYSYSENSIAAITVNNGAFPTSPNLDRNDFTIVQSIATDDSELFKANDTLVFTQFFENYYALDDGTAEASYGINASGGKLAMLFNISEQDTLKAVQIHFEQNYEDASGVAFSITIWDSQSGEPSDILYQSQIFYPEYTNLKNGFFEYVLENPIVVSSSIFVGWEQYYDDIINVGLDKNTINNSRMFYNLGGGWNNSDCADCDGTWMIRPVFGYFSDLSNLIENSLLEYSIYPNPSNETVSIIHNNSFKLTVYNISGQIVFQSPLSQRHNFNVSLFPSGVYLLELNDQNQITREKLIVE
jgi:hypothetical protein